jgi:anaerobic selenocysteine-containing dehydrogenase
MSSISDLANIRVVKAACPHDCPDTCALEVHVKDGVAIKVVGAAAHSATDGVLCAKVSRYTERTYHPERLTVPLKRVGKKGEGKFEAVSWEDALTDIAQRLKAIAAKDARRILPYSYAGTMGLVQGEGMAQRFFNRLGAAFLKRTICSDAGKTGVIHTLGAAVGMDVEQFAHSKLILIWGGNPVTSSVHFWRLAQQAKRNGAKLIAIDPYCSDSAAKCDQHIALRPGTDAALALGLIAWLIEKNKLDHEYVARYTLGFEALKARAAQFSLARVASICGISEAQIERLAIELAACLPDAQGVVTTPLGIRLNYGMQRTRGGGNAARAVVSLATVLGTWRHKAGGFLLTSSGWHAPHPKAWTGADLYPNTLPKRAVNMVQIGDALLDQADPIEALIVYNSNPLAVAPDSEKVMKGFAREDLFTVVLEHFQTDTADYADYVLPATTQLEHFDLHKTYGHWYLVANHPAIAPMGQALPNTEIFRRLATKMGFSEPCFGDSDETIARGAYDWNQPRLKGLDFDEILTQGWGRLPLPTDVNPFAQGGFPTASGKVEFYSETLAAQGLDPVPNYIAPYEAVAAVQERVAAGTEPYRLAMISPPARNFMNSTFVNVASLRKSEKEQCVELCAADATERGLEHGELVEVFNDRGAFQARLVVTDKVRDGLAVAFGVWWHKLTATGRNVNAVTHQRLTDLGEAPTFYDCLVEVRKANVACEARV